jgi:hypothetical protein
MDIGKPIRTVVVEPLEDPFETPAQPLPERETLPLPTPAPAPEQVPA